MSLSWNQFYILSICLVAPPGQGDLTDLLAALPEALEAGEFRIKITEPDFKPVGARVLADLNLYITKGEPPANWRLADDNNEGADHAWCTDPDPLRDC